MLSKVWVCQVLAASKSIRSFGYVVRLEKRMVFPVRLMKQFMGGNIGLIGCTQ